MWSIINTCNCDCQVLLTPATFKALSYALERYCLNTFVCKIQVHDIPLSHHWVRKLTMKLRSWVTLSLTITFINNATPCHHLLNNDTNSTPGPCLSVNSQNAFPRAPCFCVFLLLFRRSCFRYTLELTCTLLVTSLNSVLFGGVNGWVINERKDFITILA